MKAPKIDIDLPGRDKYTVEGWIYGPRFNVKNDYAFDSYNRNTSPRTSPKLIVSSEFMPKEVKAINPGYEKLAKEMGGNHEYLKTAHVPGMLEKTVQAV